MKSKVQNIVNCVLKAIICQFVLIAIRDSSMVKCKKPSPATHFCYENDNSSPTKIPHYIWHPNLSVIRGAYDNVPSISTHTYLWI